MKFLQLKAVKRKSCQNSKSESDVFLLCIDWSICSDDCFIGPSYTLWSGGHDAVKQRCDVAHGRPTAPDAQLL
eukprot:6326067-Amphidinium_carterae.1